MEVASRWFKRITVTCLVTGGVAYVGWKGINMLLQQQVPDTSDTARKQEHYVRIQMNCLTAVRNLMSPLKEVILTSLSTESITTQIRETDEQSLKISLWEKLKVISFSRAVVSACVCSLLVMIVRLQFSIVAAYLYSNKESITEDIQRQYLSTIHQSLQNGLPFLVQQVKLSAEKVLVQYSLKHKVTIENIKEIILQILDNTSSHTNKQGVSWLSSFTAVLEDSLFGSNKKLDQLLMATQDILEIEDTHTILEELVERAIHQETCIITEAFHSAAQSSMSLPMAKVIPIVSDNAIFLLQSQNQLSLLQEMTNKDQLMTLSRNCYEAFSQSY